MGALAVAVGGATSRAEISVFGHNASSNVTLVDVSDVRRTRKIWPRWLMPPTFSLPWPKTPLPPSVCDEHSVGVTSPVCISQTQAVHTGDDATEEKFPLVGGVVVVSFIIGKDGRVRTLTTEQTVDWRFTQDTFAAVGEWRYRPARRNGEPVEFRLCVHLWFTESSE